MQNRVVALAVILSSMLGGAFLDGALRSAHPALAVALPVAVYVSSTNSNQAANTCTQTIVLGTGDVSGLTNFSETFTNPSSTCRYATGATATINLP